MRKTRSDVVPKVWLPKGLAEFEASLHDLRFAPELVSRLPKKAAENYRVLFRQAMKAVEAAEEAARLAREQARLAAWAAWGTCLESYTIPQLQRATGYDQEE